MTAQSAPKESVACAAQTAANCGNCEKSFAAPMRLGIDLGSVTVKYVLVDANDEVVAREYVRHESDVFGTLRRLMTELARKIDGQKVLVHFTGSGALRLAGALAVPFVQEVVAAAERLRRYPKTIDAAVELGGEDAKILYLTGGEELRMNETCAGGTGAFVDQMAALLALDSSELNARALQAQKSHPMASRCGVFAKTDVVGLLNSGVPKGEIARSVFDAVAQQTVGGLSCGRRLKGRIAFLGGPLTFLKALREAFERRIGSENAEFELIADGQFVVAQGAAQSFDPLDKDERSFMTISELVERLERVKGIFETGRGGAPLFNDAAQLAAFRERHARERVPRKAISEASGALYLGVDLGSTTAKGVLVTQAGEICASWYSRNGGDPLATLFSQIEALEKEIPEGARIRSVLTTGYGAELAAAALGTEFTEVETLAHLRGARAFAPDATFVIDIGGQDMKCMKVDRGLITSIALNEACSSGCGAFLETFAKQLGMDMNEFVRAAMESKHPCELGSRCTVFMNSKVREAQRDGATPGDIAAGLAVSVVRNALEKVLRIPSVEALGDKVVVEGGTFLNDAVLRAFELRTGLEVIRPDAAGLMGAYGAALLALERTPREAPDWSSQNAVLTTEGIIRRDFRCRGCANACNLTMSRFPSGRKFVSGNRCEFGLKHMGGAKKRSGGFVEEKIDRLFAGALEPVSGRVRGTIGLPRCLTMWEHYPFWRAVFTRLDFRVLLSPLTDEPLMREGSEAVPSQSLCLPAKLAHGHISWLGRHGAEAVWFPCAPKEGAEPKKSELRERPGRFACPVAGGYPEVARLSEELSHSGIKVLTPFVDLSAPETVERAILEAFPKLEAEDVRLAVEAGAAAQAQYQSDLSVMARKVWDAPGFVVVLAGRPYHLDPMVNHGIPTLIESMGGKVVTEDAAAMMLAPEEKIEAPVINQWTFHGRLYRAAQAAFARPDTAYVQLASFGCGIDAVTSEALKRMHEAKGRLYTMLKIDETDTLGAARIRLRSLFAVHQESGVGAASPAAHFSRPTSAKPVFWLKQLFKPKTFAQKIEDAARTGSALSAKSFEGRTIYVPQMAPVHFPLIVAALRSLGVDVKLLDDVTDRAVELGLKYVNNDACYPAVVTIGQLVEKALDKDFDAERSVFMLTQTCGPCRATNYPTLLSWALKDAGRPEVPVVTLSAKSLAGFAHLKLGLKGVERAALAVVAGDALQRLYMHARANAPQWRSRVEETLRAATERISSALASGERKRVMSEVARAGEDFSKIPTDGVKRPKVGIVGEILLAYHPKANQFTAEALESEGAEVVMPDLGAFISYCLLDPVWQAAHAAGPKTAAWMSSAVLKVFEGMRREADRMIEPFGFAPKPDIRSMAELVKGIVSEGQQAGEGWLLTAEMLAFIEENITNVLCLQPFGCLPNHITGRGAAAAVRRRDPRASIMSIDFEGATARSNVVNRLKLFMAQARERMPEDEAARASSDAADLTEVVLAAKAAITHAAAHAAQAAHAAKDAAFAAATGAGAGSEALHQCSTIALDAGSSKAGT